MWGRAPRRGTMGKGDGKRRRVSERRACVRQLEEHGDVVAVAFTRDGFRTLLVEGASEDGLDGELRRRAERLRYVVEPPETDGHRRWRLAEWWEGTHESVRVLGLDPDRERSAP